MKKCMLLLMGGACASLVWAESVGSFDSNTGTLTYDVSADTTETQSFSSYGAVKKVVKKGVGTLTIQPANTDFNGAIDIDEGVFAAGTTDKTQKTVLGTATITVKGGAQFRSNQTCTQQDKYFTSCNIFAEGEGPDGSGAIVMCGSGMCDASIPNTTMTGPMTFGGTVRGGFGGTLDMGGFTLTNKVTDQFMWTKVTLMNPGHIVHMKKGNSITLELRGFDGGADHELIYGIDGAIVNYWSNWQTLNWTLHVKENGNIQTSASNGSGANTWKGPVVIDAGKTLTMRQSYEVIAKPRR